MRALILAVVLALSAGVAHADSVRPNAAQQEDARPIIAQAYAQAQSGDTAGIIATLSPLVHSAAFPQLSDEQRFVAEVLLGGALSDNNRGAEALPLLQQATDFSGADGDVWTMRLWAGYAANDFPDVATCIETLGQRFPDKLNEISLKGMSFIMMGVQDAPNHDALALRVLSVTHDHWRPADPFVRHFQYSQLTRLLLDAGQIQRARQVAAEIDAPGSLVFMMIDRRFDPVLPNRLDAAGLRALYERDLARELALTVSNPDLLEGVNNVIDTLIELNRADEALRLADAAIARATGGDPKTHYTDQDDNLNWTYNHRARALRLLGRYDDAIAAMRAGAERGEDGGVNVSQQINLGEFLIAAGHNDEAAQAMNAVSDTNVSKYGWMNAQFVRACARHRAGQEAEAQAALTAMRARAEDARVVMIAGEMCFGNLDEAARFLIERLNDPKERTSALVDAQRYITASNRSAFDREDDERWSALVARPDVQAAIAQYGRILDLPTVREPF
ncbi:MAG: hypothetical protein ABUS57_07950 [Pseudomonadota bacterium]